MSAPTPIDEVRIRQIIGERIRQARTTAHITQQTVAGAIGIDKGQVSRWERGHLAPTVLQLMHIGRVCGVRPEQLIGNLIEPPWEQLTNGLDAEAQAIVLSIADALIRRGRGAAGDGSRSQPAESPGHRWAERVRS